VNSTHGVNLEGIEAIIFDMDGTLVDSEIYTIRAIEELTREAGLSGSRVQPDDVYGVTWDVVSERVLEAFPELGSDSVSLALQRHFRAISQQDGCALIPGSGAYFAIVSREVKVGLYTSNVRAAVTHLLGEHTCFEGLDTIVTSEDVTESKPSPQGYLLAAQRLGVQPERCLVFEDSTAGLKAARAAGMRTVGVTHRCADLGAVQALAGQTISDYRALLN
jgi:sugar-phosphatase